MSTKDYCTIEQEYTITVYKNSEYVFELKRKHSDAKNDRITLTGLGRIPVEKGDTIKVVITKPSGSCNYIIDSYSSIQIARVRHVGG